jgi:hypothetical protein
MTNLHHIIEAANLAMDEGRVSEGIDIIYNAFDDAMHAGRWEDIDNALLFANCDFLHTVCMLSLLTITLPGRREYRLQHRAAFYNSAEAEILKRKEPEDDLLLGLGNEN